METGYVFNIQRFSVNDGPGIRTTVFMKGCPLNCLWCHNPESKSASAEIFFSPQKCLGCRACETACPHGGHLFDENIHTYLRESCDACGSCSKACVTGALETVGEKKTVGEVLSEVLRDQIFYSTSGGGMTLSGGEPTYQFDFALALLRAAKEEGLHTCIETCGAVGRERLCELVPFVDIFLFDCKETDPARHKEYTGVSNEKILENLRYIDSLGAKTILRCPIIPSLNDREDHFEKIAEIANSLENIIEINIEPYHPLGSRKSEMLGKEYPLSHLTFPEEKTVQEWIKSISGKTKVPVKKA